MTLTISRLLNTFFIICMALFFIGPFSILVIKSIGDSLNTSDLNFIYSGFAKSALSTFYVVTCSTFFILFWGSGLAFLTTFYDFRYKSILRTLCILPISIPLYIYAFVFLGLFDYSSITMSFMRGLGLDFTIPAFCLLVLTYTIGLVPYSFMLFEKKFKNLDPHLFFSVESLGLKKGKIKLFFPLVRPTIVLVFVLSMMEMVSDFGAASVLNVDTVSTFIYLSWTTFFSLGTAAKLSLIISLCMIGLLFFETKIDYKKTSVECSNGRFVRSKDRLFYGLFLLLLLYITFSLVLTVGLLGAWTLNGGIEEYSSSLFRLVGYSFFFAAFCASFIVILGGLVTLFTRLSNSKVENLMKFSQYGYSLPGVIVAIIFLSFVTSVPALIPFTFYFVVLALAFKLFSVPYKNFYSYLSQYNQNIDLAGFSLGLSPYQVAKKIHLPLIKTVFPFAFLATFLEVLKEMPINVVLRNSEHQTLATKIFELTSEGEWERASLYGLILVICSFLIGLILLKGKKHVS